jgi:hypothetical protein
MQIWGNGDAWKEIFLLSRFAAPTSAGILFTMLIAAGLKHTWVYKKVQVLAIFDDLDTILLMIPLQILMIGMRWQMFVILMSPSCCSGVLKKKNTYNLRQTGSRYYYIPHHFECPDRGPSPDNDVFLWR